MPLTPTEIEISYQLALARMPSENEITNVGNNHTNMASLRLLLLHSGEFYGKFKEIRTKFENQQTPILVHMQIPHASPPALTEALSTAPRLQSDYQVDMAGFAELCALPQHKRQQIRYVHGDLDAGAGAALDLPWRRLCSIRQPGPRIYQLYRAAYSATEGADMPFGRYLEYSLDSLEHRIELDNGQLRRLAGRTGPDDLGQESAMLRQALHAALGPDTFLGLFEQPSAVLRALAGQGFVDPEWAAAQDAGHDGADPDYEAALRSLTADQREILDSYTAWDTYLYTVCAAVIHRPDA